MNFKSCLAVSLSLALSIMLAPHPGQAAEVFPMRLMGKIIPQGMAIKNNFLTNYNTSNSVPNYFIQGPCVDPPFGWCSCSPPGTGSGCDRRYLDYMAAHLVGPGQFRPVGCYDTPRIGGPPSKDNCTSYSTIEPYPEANNIPK